VTAPSSSPRGERAPRPGAHWDTVLVRRERVIDETSGPDMNQPDEPQPNRATRRALARKARRTTVNNPADNGPSVREAAADDRLWPLEKHGE
jgi:hypothetical protein